MKAIIKITLLIITATTYLSCSSDSFLNSSNKSRSEQSKTITKHSNGHLASEYFTNNGVKDGKYTEWFPSGGIQIEREYDMGNITSEKLYTLEGEIIKNIVIKDGRKYGLLYSSFCVNGVAKNPENDSLIFESKEK